MTVCVVILMVHIIYDHEKAYPAYLITYALEDVQ